MTNNRYEFKLLLIGFRARLQGDGHTLWLVEQEMSRLEKKHG